MVRFPVGIRDFCLAHCGPSCCGSLQTSQQIESTGSVCGLKRLKLESERSPSHQLLQRSSLHAGRGPQAHTASSSSAYLRSETSAILSRRVGKEVTKSHVLHRHVTPCPSVHPFLRTKRAYPTRQRLVRHHICPLVPTLLKIRKATDSLK